MGFRNGLKKVGRVYHYKFKRGGCAYHGSTGLESLSQAREWLRRFREATVLQEQGIVPIPTIEALGMDWLESKRGVLSDAHLNRAELTLRLHINPAIGQIALDAVRTSDVERLLKGYLDTPKQGGKARSKEGANVLLCYLNLLYGWAIKRGILTKLPYSVIPFKVQQKPRSYIPLSSLDDFLAFIDKRKNLHVSVAIRAMLYMGLRESEALGMRWEWFSMDGQTYTPGRTKGREAVPLPVPANLAEWLAKCPREGEWVLPAANWKQHHMGFTKKAIARAGNEAGIKGLSPHRLRATTATLLAQNGVGAHLIQKMLRHKSLSTTLRYVELGLEDMRRAQARVFAPATSPEGPVDSSGGREVATAEATGDQPKTC